VLPSMNVLLSDAPEASPIINRWTRVAKPFGDLVT
jgi:hypothetical protein